jgi:polyisoprenoid-binding protein YceI
MRIALAFAAFLAALVPAIAGVSLNPQSAPKGSYAIDPNHTSVTFCIRHMGISNYCGRFGGASGKIVFNGSQPDRSKASIDVDVAGIDTPSAKLNDELKRNFFETDKFPKATFVSKAITLTGKSTADITGDLTLHGVTKPVTLHTTFIGGTQHPLANAYALGFSANAKINVSDFSFPDVDWKIFVGNEVTLSIDAEFIAEK